MLETEKLRAKLVKLLNLTNSDIDPEALNAIRFANDLLRKNQLNWDSLFNPPKFQEPDRKKKTDQKRSESLKITFEFIYENAWASFDFTFIDSLHERFEEGGDLTNRQLESLLKVYETVKKYAK